MFKHPHCGGKHSTAAEARACQSAGLRVALDQMDAKFGREKTWAQGIPAPTRSTAQTAVLDRLRTQHTRNTAARVRMNPATDAQLDYLDILIGKRDWTFEWDKTRNDDSVLSLQVSLIVRDRLAGSRVQFEEASEAITAMKPMRNKVLPPTTPAPAQGPTPNRLAELLAQVPDGRYAVDRDGKVHFFVVKPARHGSDVRVVREKASDTLHKMYRNAQAGALREILATGLEKARMLYADTLSACWKCGRDLTDTDNPFKPFGLGPDCGPKVMAG